MVKGSGEQTELLLSVYIAISSFLCGFAMRQCFLWLASHIFGTSLAGACVVSRRRHARFHVVLNLNSREKLQNFYN